MDQDIMAERHGAFINQLWIQIGKARALAQKPCDLQTCSAQRRHLRQLQDKLHSAYQEELSRKKVKPFTIDAWFAPVAASLERAETHFDQLIKLDGLRVLSRNPPMMSAAGPH